MGRKNGSRLGWNEHGNQFASRNRKPRLERFETRALFASDCLHNIEIPEDADGSGDVSALDALAIINQLNGASTSSAVLMTDVDTDAATTPLDALAVINHLNRHSGERAASAISSESRIARIEASIAGGTLASAFSLEEAIDILATLRSGKRPELGERLADSRNEQLSIERLSTRLTSAGVSSEIVETMVSEIKSAKEAGTPLTKVQVLTRLAELGVDVDQIFPAREDHTPSTDRFIEKLTSKLTTAGVATATIETITLEMRSAIEAGEPLTLAQVKARLEELGVDTTAIFPAKQEHPREDRFLTQLTTQLTTAGVDVAIIATITQEIEDAKASGDKLSVSEIKSRLVELGVDTSTIDLSPPRRGNRGGSRGPR